MSETRCDITLTVNGETVAEAVDARKTLVDFLRDDLVLTGSHVGCEHGVCGACTVRVNGVIVRGCLMLAAQCDGANVETVEGVSDTGEITDLQKAFEQRNALQCGFCTPAMLITARDLILRFLDVLWLRLFALRRIRWRRTWHARGGLRRRLISTAAGDEEQAYET